MKIIFIVPVFFFLLLLSPRQLFCQDPAHLYRVVLVKGTPLLQDKKMIRDGQKIEDKEKVMFTRLDEVIILLNLHFDKIKIQPKNQTELRKLLKVQDYISAVSSKPSRGTQRGMSNEMSFQSATDTLRLHLSFNLKKALGSDLKNFKLLDRYMESESGRMKTDGEFLLLFPQKPGTYSLYYTNEKGQSEVLAELEFMDPLELKAELKYVANATSPKDSVSSQQVRYIRKLYPNVPDNQIAALIATKP